MRKGVHEAHRCRLLIRRVVSGSGRSDQPVGVRSQGTSIGCRYHGLPTQSAPIRNPIGADMSFRRAVFDRTSGFTSGVGRVGRTPLGIGFLVTAGYLRGRLTNGTMSSAPGEAAS